MTALDSRILRPGMSVAVSTLVDVYQDHDRGDASVCPGCGHQFPKGDDTSDCPTLAVVRPLLRRRRFEDRQAAARLTPEQVKDLTRTRTTKTNHRTAVRPAPEPDLFDTAPYRRTEGLR